MNDWPSCDRILQKRIKADCPDRARRRISIAVAPIILSCCLGAFARPQAHPVQYIGTIWQTEQGLPQNSVNAILQDQQGYLWIGTFGGLARFDGERFRIFTSADTPRLSSSKILSLYESRSGVLWIGTTGNGLTRLHDGVARTYTERDGLPSGFISSIRADAAGNMWINTATGVARLAGEKIQAYGTHRRKAVREFYLQSKDGSMWFHSEADVVRFGPDGSIAALKASTAHGFLIEQARDGSVWIGFPDQARLVRYWRGSFSDVPLPRGQLAFLGKDSRQGVVAMARDTDGELVLLTTAGLVRVADGRLSHPEALSVPATTREVRKVRTLLVDREGNRWVGADGAGLLRFRKAPLTAYGKDEGLSDASPSAVFQDRQGRIWFGGDLLHWFDGHQFRLLSGVRDVRAIAQTLGGDLWFGGYGGLHRLRAGALTFFGIDAPAVRAIHEDRHGTLWIGAAAEDRPGGLYRLHGGTLKKVPGWSDVYVILEDRAGALWAGGVEGLALIKDGEVVPYGQKESPTHIAALHQDSTGSLWIASYGGGLYRLRDERFTAITTKHGLPNNMLLGVLEEGGDLWVGSNQNIFRLSLKELDDFADGKLTSVSAVSYGVAEGMRSSECNGGSPSIQRTTDGRLWFPTQRGMVAIDPHAVNRLPPPVVIEEARARDTLIGQSGTTQVPAGNNTLTFRFAALSFSAPEKTRFRYRLEPYDKEWVDAGAQRTAHYTNMSPGRYSFQVIAANSYGVWNREGATVSFALEPHFYHTRWFYLLAATGIVACAAGAYRLRIRQIRVRELHLAQLVNSRTVELRAEIETREAVEASLRQARAELENRVRERTAELSESEQRFRTFVDHAADAFFVLDFEESTVFDVNREACENLGYAREELIGQHSTLFDVDIDRTALESIAQRAANGETVFDTHWHRRKDGSVFPVEVHTSVLWYRGRQFLLKMARDITDRLRAEEEREKLRQLESDLAHINRVSMLGELSASIAHELNQPLTGIVSNGSASLRWLDGDPPDLEEVREAVNDIVRDGKRAGDVIARIRGLTKRAAPPREELDLNHTVREVLALVEDEAKRQRVVIRTQFADGLCPVSGDRVQLQQVMLNLVMNALEAMSGVEGRPRELVISTRNLDAGQVQVSVADSGPGLDPNTANRIFEPFFTTKDSGMGMGLSICRSIVQSHGGRLWASVHDGPGTAFHFTVAAHQERTPQTGVAGT